MKIIRDTLILLFLGTLVLIPFTAISQETQDEAPTVEFPKDKQQFTGVKMAKAEIIQVTKKIRTIGRVEFDEKSFVTINTKFEGWIEKLHVNYTGKMVSKGEILAEIYSPELYATQQEYLSIRKWAKEKKSGDTTGQILQKDSDSLLAAARQRLRLWDITDEQIKNLEKTGSPIRTIKIFSPASGFVLTKQAVQGMKIMPGEKLFDLADLSTVWIIADIYENDLAFIKQGQKARITLSYFPGRPIESKIDYIYPDLDPQTRTVKVRFIIKNPDSGLKPQMFTNVELEASLGERLVIPKEAVIDTGARKLVYVNKDEDYFQIREVKTGITADGLTEIVSGIKEGDLVAATGNFLIDSEAQLKGIIPSDKH